MAQHLPSSVSFRQDINGLRAWAVFAVLLFHFPWIGLPGGFIGVDLFFVISGYLMTAIVVQQHEQGRFSVRGFYQARLRRILPALMLMLLVVWIVGWLWLPTAYYQNLADHILVSLAFVSNFDYATTKEYFVSSPDEMWLLHTWSLAVEAQFYLLFPIFVVLWWRFFPSLKSLSLALGVLTVFSFFLNLHFIDSKTSWTFYMLPMRGWELAIGGLVYLFARQVSISLPWRTALYRLGWVLILISLWLLDGSLPWPGHYALLPVLGIAFVILANQHSWLTDWRGFQWLGDRSYSLYLWHWPLVAALYFVGKEQDGLWVMTALVLSFVLAHLSFLWVEVPTRRFFSTKKQRASLLWLSGIWFVLFFMVLSIQSKWVDLTNRVDPTFETIAKGSFDKFPGIDPCWLSYFDAYPNVGLEDPQICRFPANSAQSPTIALVGDSHTGSVLSALIAADQASQKQGVLFLGTNGCPFLPGVSLFLDPGCGAYNRFLFQQLLQDSTLTQIFIVNRLNKHLHDKDKTAYQTQAQINQMFAEFKDGVEQLTQSGKKVVILTSIPEMTVNVPKTLIKQWASSADLMDIRLPIEQYHQRAGMSAAFYQDVATLQNVTLLDASEVFCDAHACYGSQRLTPWYFDDNHLSEQGGRKWFSYFKQVLNEP